MYVLLDIEWVENTKSNPNPGRWLTQLSAARVDENLQIVERFDRIIRPIDPEGSDWSFMAYNGYTPEQFADAESEENCIKAFDEWLREDDVFLCWHEETKHTMNYLDHRYLGHKCKTHSVRIKYGVEKWLQENGSTAKGFYDEARACGCKDVKPEHCSRLDIDLMQEILRRVDFSAELFEEAYPKRKDNGGQKKRKKRITKGKRRKRNAKRMEAMQLEFCYTPNSKVFHRRGCKLLLCAVEIRECRYYKKAATVRRPCKVCKPEPLPEELSGNAPAKKSKPRKYMVPCEPDIPTDDPEVFVVTMLGGKQKKMNPQDLVGCCHSAMHPGKIDLRLMKRHRCEAKHCRQFEAYKDTCGWKEWRTYKHHLTKKKRKEKLQAERAEKERADAQVEQGSAPAEKATTAEQET